jgi:type I restriction enzyme S subunit
MATKHSLHNWQTKKLGEVCDIGAGNSAPQKKEMFDGGKYPFFRTSDVGRIRFGVIDDSTDKLNEIGIKKLHLYKKGTLLLPKSGASTFLNHRVLMTIDGYVSSHLATLKAKDNILDDRFLLYFSSTIDSRNLMQDQNYPSLRLSDIQEINILLPSFYEQKRIVAILDEVFAETKKLEAIYQQKLADLDELKKSVLQKAFEGEL